MRQAESVEMDHDREKHSGIFTNTKGPYGHIECFLIVLAKRLDPARIPNGHSVRVVSPHAQGCRKSSVADCHHYWIPHRRRNIDYFMHKFQALTCSSSEGPRPYRSRSKARAHG